MTHADDTRLLATALRTVDEATRRLERAQAFLAEIEQRIADSESVDRLIEADDPQEIRALQRELNRRQR